VLFLYKVIEFSVQSIGLENTNLRMFELNFWICEYKVQNGLLASLWIQNAIFFYFLRYYLVVPRCFWFCQQSMNSIFRFLKILPCCAKHSPSENKLMLWVASIFGNLLRHLRSRVPFLFFTKPWWNSFLWDMTMVCQH